MDNPLNKANYKEINQALFSLNEAQRAIERAKRANINCDEFDQVCQHYKDHLEALKKEYFKSEP